MQRLCHACKESFLGATPLTRSASSELADSDCDDPAESSLLFQKVGNHLRQATPGRSMTCSPAIEPNYSLGWHIKGKGPRLHIRHCHLNDLVSLAVVDNCIRIGVFTVWSLCLSSLCLRRSGRRTFPFHTGPMLAMSQHCDSCAS